MTLNLVIKSDAPFPPYTCELICIQPEAVPFLLYGIFHKLQKYYWASHSDWIIGRRLMVAEGIELLMPCGHDIINSIDRVYNLLDTRLAGNERSVTGLGTEVDPFVYDPPLEQAATNLAGINESLLLYATVQHEAWLNLLNGDTSDVFTDDRNLRQQIEDLILAVEASETDNTEVVAKLVEIIGLLA